MAVIKIVLLPVDLYDRRRDAETIENNEFSIHDLLSKYTGIELYELTDFMDLYNDQELNLDKYWMSYVTLKD